jgi:hypothetical protein
MSYTPETHIKNRTKMLAAIAGEIFGPGSSFDGKEDPLMTGAKEFDIDGIISFSSWEDYSAVRPVVKGTGEEILKDERPLGRYGLGVLFPEVEGQTENDDAEDDETLTAEEATAGIWADDSEESAEQRKVVAKQEEKRELELERRGKQAVEDCGLGEEDLGSDAVDLRLANLRRQRCLGISFVVDAGGNGDMMIDVMGGRYRRIEGIVVKDAKKDKEHQISWWARLAVIQQIRIPLKDILSAAGTPLILPVELPQAPDLPPLKVQVEVLVRPRDRIPGNEHPQSACLITVTLVNRTKCSKKDRLDLNCLFQSRFTVTTDGCDESAILWYPESTVMKPNDEQQSLNLLYRRELTFATGHGCAGMWEAPEDGQRAALVRAEPLPSFQTPSITPELEFGEPDSDGRRSRLTIPVRLLSNNADWDKGLAQLELTLNLYKKWIKARKDELPAVPPQYTDAAKRHIEQCEEALARMQRGLDLLRDPKQPEIAQAFQWTNKAMLLQALASRSPTRVRQYDKDSKRVFYEPAFTMPDAESPEASNRTWRPIQIAFLLMNLPGLADPSEPSNEIVDLIWFPTGGGKTEAYLGCAAFSMFMRRLRNRDDEGTQVLMRYTLRLLTAQQFQRASALICAMEIMRRGLSDSLGEKPFTIGIWVGGETTPNTIDGARRSISKTTSDGEEEYKLILLKCPWCGAVMGPRKVGIGNKRRFEIDGVVPMPGDVRIHCPDVKCNFANSLPVEVIDEKIYQAPPTYVIATVDKFASLSWKETCRSLFGLGADGERVATPPGLIIQDELHLITGPLGSMVGLYEGLIEELATDRRDPKCILRPKMIAATATTRASNRQIRDLYARDKTSIFPPPGLDAGDSFFASYARDKNKKRLPGRLYVGVLPLNYSSALTASVRLYAAALSAAWGFETEEERDPWWTLLVFYNSLRELGANLTLFGADIPERMKNVQRRWYPGSKMRFLNEPLELTGRLANSEVPRALEALTRPYVAKPANGHYPVSACLASNIIEVGVDVDRLGLMAVAGQPKTTAQYIQATGRVGRRPGQPGVILVNYGATKARDRSHYEHFQAYHARLYAQVEPSSVTPFTIPVLERALHAVIVAWVRQTLPLTTLAAGPSQFAGTGLESAARNALEILKTRIQILSADNADSQRLQEDLESCFNRRIKEWAEFLPVKWHEYFPKRDSADQPLLRPYGSPCPREWEGFTWETPNSLRGVDAECRPHIPLRQQLVETHD